MDLLGQLYGPAITRYSAETVTFLVAFLGRPLWEYQNTGGHEEEQDSGGGVATKGKAPMVPRLV